ncbi:MAG: hypothetical protein U0744_18235 [Gemmataceae bacterium]
MQRQQILGSCVLLVLILSSCSRPDDVPVRKPLAVEVLPSLKLEIEPEAPAVRSARWFTSARIKLFVRSSRDHSFRLILPAGEGKSVFFISGLPKSRPGEEFVVEVWDDQTTSAEEQDRIANAIAAGGRLVIRAVKEKTYLIDQSFADAPEIDVMAKSLASWRSNDWLLLGKATAIVGDNGLPNLRHANPIAIVAVRNQHETIGKVMLHADADIPRRDAK